MHDVRTFLIGTVARAGGTGRSAATLWKPGAGPTDLGHRGGVPPTGEPLSRADLALLRRLVLEHKSAERRLRFPPVLHLGAPGGPVVGRVVEDSANDLDHALRCDLVEAMLKRTGTLARDRPLMTWLTRPGPLDVQDVDLAWLRAVATVNGETERDLAYVVVTRDGWRDPRTGAGRTWLRLRQR
jgi:hypothetical protein